MDSNYFKFDTIGTLVYSFLILDCFNVHRCKDLYIGIKKSIFSFFSWQ